MSNTSESEGSVDGTTRFPDEWLQLRLPAPASSLIDAIAQEFERSRVPAAISTPSRPGVAAVVHVLRDASGDILALADDYLPELRFIPVERAALESAVAAIVPGFSATEDADALRGPSDAIAWIGEESPEVYQLVAGRIPVEFATIPTTDGRFIVVPADDHESVVSSGVWGSSALTLWRCDERLIALSGRRGVVLRHEWGPGWRIVDPSRTDQTFADVALAELFVAVTGAQSDPSDWIHRFALDAADGERLRVLMRAEHAADTAHRLTALLGMPPELAARLDDDAPPAANVSGYEVVEPATTRQLVAGLFRKEFPAPPAGTVSPGWESGWWKRWGERHSIVRLVVVCLLATATTVLAWGGLLAGRSSAALPAFAACLWWITAAVDLRWLGRRLRARRDQQSIERDDEADA